MPIELTYAQRTTYQGTNFTYFGGEPFIWDGTQYVSTSQSTARDSLSSVVDTTQGKKAILKFSAKLLQPEKSSTTTLSADSIEVFVDGIRYDEEDGLEKTSRYIQLSFDDIYLRTQRIIEFTSNKGECVTKFAVKTGVYDDNDVVVASFGESDPQPILGDTPTPSDFTTSASGGGASNTTTFQTDEYNQNIVYVNGIRQSIN